MTLVLFIQHEAAILASEICMTQEKWEAARAALHHDASIKAELVSLKAKLSRAQVGEILEKWNKGGVTKRALALEYSVNESTIARAINGQTWKGAR